MLSIILGEKGSKEILGNKKFVDYNDGLFDDEYDSSWYDDKFIQQVLQDIDHIDLSKSNGITFVNSITGNIHSHKELSTGCKTLILIYKFPGVIFQARFGDNCTDLVEQIASKTDVIIKSDYLHSFNFKYVKEINYINYNTIARSTEDIFDLLTKFRDDNSDSIEETQEEYDSLTIDQLWEKHPRFMAELFQDMRE